MHQPIVNLSNIIGNNNKPKGRFASNIPSYKKQEGIRFI
jgi:hypothetical protein